MRRRGEASRSSGTSARDSALRALARREHSAAELAEKLKRRGHAEDQVSAAIERLAQAGLQSDTRFAEMIVRSRIRDGHGPQRIEAELHAAGIDDAGITAALEIAQCDWSQLAIDVHARKFRHLPANAAEWQKQYRFLAGRGFDAAQIHGALRRERENAPGDS